MIARIAHFGVRVISIVPVAAVLAAGWAVLQGPSDVVELGSQRATEGQEPAIEVLGWHIIGWAGAATVFALAAIRALLPTARREVERREYRRLLRDGADEDWARFIAHQIAEDWGPAP